MRGLVSRGPALDAREEQPDRETDWRPYPQERPSHMPAQRQGMNRTDLRELHNIAHFANLPSILTHGILSHNRARKRNPTSIANQEVQEIRHSKSVPGGRPLHDYANLYISARNAMLYKVLGLPESPPPSHITVGVLSVNTKVLDLP